MVPDNLLKKGLAFWEKTQIPELWKKTDNTIDNHMCKNDYKIPLLSKIDILIDDILKNCLKKHVSVLDFLRILKKKKYWRELILFLKMGPSFRPCLVLAKLSKRTWSRCLIILYFMISFCCLKNLLSPHTITNNQMSRLQILLQFTEIRKNPFCAIILLDNVISPLSHTKKKKLPLPRHLPPKFNRV